MTSLPPRSLTPSHSFCVPPSRLPRVVFCLSPRVPFVLAMLGPVSVGPSTAGGPFTGPVGRPWPLLLARRHRPHQTLGVSYPREKNTHATYSAALAALHNQVIMSEIWSAD